MDLDQIKGKAQNAFGKAEHAVGDAVGSKDLSNAGLEDEVKGAGKETWGNVKDAAHTVASGGKIDAEKHGDNLRDKISHGVEHVRESANTHLNNFKEHQAEKNAEKR